jgi:hypothetical protein
MAIVGRTVLPGFGVLRPGSEACTVTHDEREKREPLRMSGAIWRVELR